MFHSSPSYKYIGDLNRSWYPGGGRPPLPPTMAEHVKIGPPKQVAESEPSFPEKFPNFHDNNANNTNNVCLTAD